MDRPYDTTSHWHTTPWERDEIAQRYVREHPDGMSLEEVGDALNVTRERVRQIQDRALRRLRLRLPRAALAELAGLLADDSRDVPPMLTRYN